MDSYSNRDSHISDSSPGEVFKSRDFFCHLIEQTFNALVTILSGNVEREFVEELPFRPGLSWRFDRSQALLHASLCVSKRAALLRVSAAGQQVMRTFRGFIGQNVTHDQRFQFA